MAKKIAIWALVVIVLAAGGWLIGSRMAKKNSEAPLPQPETNTEDDSLETAGGKVWSGKLEVSDNKSRGNLMLVWEEGKPPVYINTIRDFSQFIGREVIVNYEGDTKQFRLLDIQPK